MHRSRLCHLIIDCSDETAPASLAFWSGALGKRPLNEFRENNPYVWLEGGAGTLALAIQTVRDASRIHLDIETDNVEAEVKRLEKLGATRHAFVEDWWVMCDPAGHLFCVVPPQTSDFAEKATVRASEEAADPRLDWLS